MTIYWTMVMGLVLFCHATRSLASQHLFDGYRKIIVLDPGHGGQDSGAKGADQTLEKKVALQLARQVEAGLASQFKVALTRTDDYHVALYNRTAMANHLKAHLFISIHTGAGFTHSTSGTTVYYYKNLPDVNTGQKLPPQAVSRKGNQPILWRNVQLGHIEQSQALAHKIAARLKNSTTAQVQVERAPLAVLQGADMPAVLIEIGHLTNPAEEKKLSDNRYVIDLAEKISSGIEEFIKQYKK